MRIHVVNLPHTETTAAFGWCAYTQKVRRFCDMMADRGNEVFLYAGERNEARVAEHIPVRHGNPDPSQQINPESWSPSHSLWNDMFVEAVPQIAQRQQDGDFLALIAGGAQKPYADVFPNMLTVEYGIGYEGVFAPFRVFESYAWMHMVYGAQAGWGNTMSARGRDYDAVIPNSYAPEEFPEGAGDGGYVLFIGRLVESKGLAVVSAIAERAGVRVLVAGAGDASLVPASAEYVGLVGPEERARLMGGAVATLVPTLYCEPFGGVAVESQMCGTPAITTDYGAFTETVEQGVSGWRCRDLGEFTWAVHNAGALDRAVVRARAHRMYSTEVVGDMYDAYFWKVNGVRTSEHDWFRANERRPGGRA